MAEVKNLWNKSTGTGFLTGSRSFTTVDSAKRLAANCASQVEALDSGAEIAAAQPLPASVCTVV